jgi:zinc transport system ATP-binding protein
VRCFPDRREPADPPRAPALLGLRALEVGFGGRALLPPISFEVRPGELWALLGPNGGGKTTLLRTLVGLLPAVGGAVERPVGLAIGYVPQRSSIDPAVPERVIDLVRGGLDRGLSFLSPGFRRRHREGVARVLAETSLEALAREPFATLSEGQKQRVLLARALVGEPRLLVLDEPTAAMDVAAERAVFALLDRLRRERDLGVVVVGHHLPELLRGATHVVLVDKDDGTALAGPAATVIRSPSFVARFGGRFEPAPAEGRAL